MKLLRTALLLPAASAWSRKAWTLEGLASPVDYPGACGRRSPSRVCDPELLLGAEGADKIDKALEALNTKDVAWGAGSRCARERVRGAEGAVVVLGHLDDWHHNSAEEAAKFVARGAHDAWGVGSAACSNGFLLLIAVDDRAFFLSTGAGLSRGGLLGDGRARRALDASKPYLRSGDVAAGVLASLEAIDEYLELGPPTWGEWLSEAWPLFIFLGVVGWIAVSALRQRRRELLQRQEHAAATRALSEAERVRDEPQFRAESCPVCLEDFGAGRAPKGLACGHAFCGPCLDQWVATAAAPGCPVCRAPIAGAERRATSSPSPSSAMEEARFRLASVHRRYPSVLDRVAYDTLARGGYRGSFRSAARPPPSRPTTSSSSSRYRSSGGASSFGGGRSSGGAGGRW